jgi:hypothetical protein
MEDEDGEGAFSKGKFIYAYTILVQSRTDKFAPNTKGNTAG